MTYFKKKKILLMRYDLRHEMKKDRMGVPLRLIFHGRLASYTVLVDYGRPNQDNSVPEKE